MSGIRLVDFFLVRTRTVRISCIFFDILSDLPSLTSIESAGSRQIRSIWPDKQHDSSSDRSMFKNVPSDGGCIFVQCLISYVRMFPKSIYVYMRYRDAATLYRAKMRNETFKGYGLVLVSQIDVGRVLSTRSTDRKYLSHDFHKTSEYDSFFAEYVLHRSRKRSCMAYAFCSFNTVLMIYVSEYILHRILSRINIDTGSEAFPVLSTAR